MHLREAGALTGWFSTPCPGSLCGVSMVSEEEGHHFLFQKVSVTTGAVGADPPGVSQMPHRLPHQ